MKPTTTTIQGMFNHELSRIKNKINYTEDKQFDELFTTVDWIRDNLKELSNTLATGQNTSDEEMRLAKLIYKLIKVSTISLFIATATYAKLKARGLKVKYQLTASMIVPKISVTGTRTKITRFTFKFQSTPNND
jgi:hypothetical protein